MNDDITAIDFEPMVRILVSGTVGAEEVPSDDHIHRLVRDAEGGLKIVFALED